MRLLVAQDDAGLRSALERGLLESGYVVDAVADGEQALRLLCTYDYEVAVLDWVMSEVSGIDVVRELRRCGSRLPVLMLSARDAPGDRVTGLDAGADDYMVKPFDFRELLARIRAMQRRSSAFDSPRLRWEMLSSTLPRMRPEWSRSTD
ncbi:MAG TPA: response regulator [Acidimicrobiales bacterium]|nr:response regulator [Acidimicrobiales bacterium]